MNTIELNCPHCGAMIHADDDLVSFNCPGCGYEIRINGMKTDTSLSQSEPNRALLDNNRQGKTVNGKTRFLGILAIIVLSIGIGFFMGRYSISNPGSIEVPGSLQPSTQEPTLQTPYKVWMPFSSKEARSKSYNEVYDALYADGKGFQNIRGEEITKKPLIAKKIKSGDIKEIYIVVDNKHVKRFNKDDSFSSDARIVIKYYMFD